MTEKPKYYITTPIYYPSAKLHIGHTYCTSIAQNILRNPAECRRMCQRHLASRWNAMPPHRPSLLSTFLGKITRNLSFDLYRKMHRKKRGESQMDAVLDELEE